MSTKSFGYTLDRPTICHREHRVASIILLKSCSHKPKQNIPIITKDNIGFNTDGRLSLVIFSSRMNVYFSPHNTLCSSQVHLWIHGVYVLYMQDTYTSGF